MADFPSKKHLIERVKAVIEERLQELDRQFSELQQALLSDTKSSAGDKHETSRTMTQLEQEKLGKQLHELNHMRSTFLRINSTDQFDAIQMGNIILTSEGWYYLCVPLGKVTIDEQLTLFCLSPLSPLGNLLIGKKAGDKLTFNSREIEIQTVL
jgi:hypothetical protein